MTDILPTFEQFKLSPLLQRAINDLGFSHATPIQAQVLHFTLAGHDAIGRAQTGTGKTAAFLITIINDLLNKAPAEERYVGETRALILAPTRELALQIAKDAEQLTKYTQLRIVSLVGGMDYDKQKQQLYSQNVDIVVATPGRLIDFVDQQAIYLDMLEVLVIDEADRLLDMGFIPAIKRIVRSCPPKTHRQTLFFSATFNRDVLSLAEQWLFQPVKVEIEPSQVTNETVEQLVYIVSTEQKYDLLYNLVQLDAFDRVIVFANRRDQVRRLAEMLKRHHISCAVLSGEVPQDKRVKTLESFREGKVRVLVATDVAGRGIHIDDVSHVINFTLPEQTDDYVHRIGRTGRGGANGVSISFACEDDAFLIPNLEAAIGRKLECTHPAPELLQKAH